MFQDNIFTKFGVNTDNTVIVYSSILEKGKCTCNMIWHQYLEPATSNSIFAIYSNLLCLGFVLNLRRFGCSN